MPRGKPKTGAFDFTIWFENGARAQWQSRDGKVNTNAEIAAAIRRYLVPFMERYESPKNADAVDPVAANSVDPTPRVEASSSSSEPFPQTGRSA